MLKVGQERVTGYVLKAVLDIGWHIIQSTPNESMMDQHGLGITP